MTPAHSKACSRLELYSNHAEALLLLFASRLAIRFGLARIAPWAFTLRRPEDLRPPAALEQRIARSVEGAVRFLRWKDCCLAAALTAKLMLARRGFRSSIHLGAGFKDSGRLYAHAWIDAGGRTITGGQQVGALTPLIRTPDAG